MNRILFAWLAAASVASAEVLYTVVNLEDGFGDIATYSGLATGINNLGQVVGVYIRSDLSEISAFTYSPVSGVTDLGGGNTRVSGINDAGQIAGYDFSVAFRYTPGIG